MRSVRMNGRWDVMMPEYRAFRWLAGDHERERLASMFLNLEDDAHVLDVGAEDGDMSALISTWVPQGSVSLVEPTFESWPAIRETFEANDRPPPLRAYCGYAGDGEYQTMEEARVVGGWPNECNDQPVGDHPMSQYEPGNPRTLPVDAVMKGRLRGVGAINVDVEGAELHVLRGAYNTIMMSRPLVWVSIHPHLLKARYGSKPRDVLDFFDDESLDYRAVHLGDDHESHWLFEPR